MPAPVAAPRPAAEPRPAAPAPAPVLAPAAAASGGAEPHTAPHDEIIHVIRELVQQARGRAVLIDTLARELKRRGFARTPGSPRLITRLRRIKELAVSPSGMITLIGEAAASPAPVATDDTAAAERATVPEAETPPVPAQDAEEPDEDAEEADEDEKQPILPPEVQPSRHRAPAPVIEEEDEDKPGPGNEKVARVAASAPPASQRGSGAQDRRGPRRRRRGGRGRRPAA